MQKNLFKETMQLLATKTYSIDGLAAEAGVGSRWLRYLIDGKGENYSVTKVQRVHDCLLSKQAKAA